MTAILGMHCVDRRPDGQNKPVVLLASDSQETVDEAKRRCRKIQSDHIAGYKVVIAGAGTSAHIDRVIEVVKNRVARQERRGRQMTEQYVVTAFEHAADFVYRQYAVEKSRRRGDPQPLDDFGAELLIAMTRDTAPSLYYLDNAGNSQLVEQYQTGGSGWAMADYVLERVYFPGDRPSLAWAQQIASYAILQAKARDLFCSGETQMVVVGNSCDSGPLSWASSQFHEVASFKIDVALRMLFDALQDADFSRATSTADFRQVLIAQLGGAKERFEFTDLLSFLCQGPTWAQFIGSLLARSLAGELPESGESGGTARATTDKPQDVDQSDV